LFWRRAVAGELAAVNGTPRPRETLSDEPELDRRAAEPMDQQDANAAAAEEQAAVGHLLLRPAIFVFIMHFLHVNPPSRPQAVRYSSVLRQSQPASPTFP